MFKFVHNLIFMLFYLCCDIDFEDAQIHLTGIETMNSFMGTSQQSYGLN